MNVLLLIRSLEQGGAERQLVVLAKGLHARGHRVAVAVFYGGGAFEPELEQAGVRVLRLEKRGRYDMAGFMGRWVRLVRNERPQAIYSFLPGPNFVAGVLRPFYPRVGVMWGLRASFLDPAYFDWAAGLSGWLERRLARLAHRIVVNSEVGREHALGRGFPPERLTVVPNGIDTGRFAPQPGAGAALRAAWGVGSGDLLIGHVGRLDPMKDHPTLLRAAALLRQEGAPVRFVCVGDGAREYREALAALAGELGLDGVLTWAGARDDLPAVYSAFDLFTLVSTGEGFPNVVAEAMACQVPCVVTDVGDCRRIVAETGIVVTPGDVEGISRGWRALLAQTPEQRAASGRQARQRIEQHFNVARMIEATEACLAQSGADAAGAP